MLASGRNFAKPHMFRTMEKEQRHIGGARGSSTTRYEGLLSIDAVPPRPGRLVTRPMSFDGGKLLINARVRRNGSIRVGLADAGGTMLPRFSTQDSISFR